MGNPVGSAEKQTPPLPTQASGTKWRWGSFNFGVADLQKAVNKPDSNKKKKHDTSIVSPPSPEYMSFETRDGMSRDELLGMVTEEIRYFRELRRGIRNLDMNVTAQRRQSRGVVHDLRAKAGAARSTAIVPFAKQQEQKQKPIETRYIKKKNYKKI